MNNRWIFFYVHGAAHCKHGSPVHSPISAPTALESAEPRFVNDQQTQDTIRPPIGLTGLLI